MPVSVQEVVIDNFNTGTTSRTPTLATTPAVGDVVAVAIAVRQASGGTVPTGFGVSGLTGASWAQKDAQVNTGGGGTAHVLFFGTGATAAGAISVSWTTNAVGIVRVFLIRGLTDQTVAGVSNAVTTSFTGVYTGPSSNAELGQLVLDVQQTYLAGNSGGPAMLSALVPASGWTSQANYTPGTNGKWASTYRIPAETTPTAHRTDFTNGPFGASGARITQWVIGAAAAPPDAGFTGWGVPL
jgi:hypothetical protein